MVIWHFLFQNPIWIVKKIVHANIYRIREILRFIIFSQNFNGIPVFLYIYHFISPYIIARYKYIYLVLKSVLWHSQFILYVRSRIYNFGTVLWIRTFFFLGFLTRAPSVGIDRKNFGLFCWFPVFFISFLTLFKKKLIFTMFPIYVS